MTSCRNNADKSYNKCVFFIAQKVCSKPSIYQKQKETNGHENICLNAGKHDYVKI